MSVATGIRRIELILKISDHCNLHCTYCFDMNWRSKGTLLNLDTIRSLPPLVEMLFRQYSEIDVIFHGGEPFLVPPKLFLAVMDTLSPLGVEFYAQTNLAMSRPERHNEVLARLSGLSFTLDGPEELHDAQRRTLGQSGTYSSIMRNLDWVRSKYPKLGLGVLCTLSQKSVDYCQDIYGFFKHLGVARMGLNPVFDGDNSLSNDGYSQILTTMFGEWITDPIPIDITLFVEALKWVTGIQESPSLCYGQDCFRGIVSVSPSGSLNPCLHWHDDCTFQIQNFASFDPYMAYYEKKFASFRNARCVKCPYQTFCQGGCPHEYVRGQWHFCDATQTFLGLVQSYVKAGIIAAAVASGEA